MITRIYIVAPFSPRSIEDDLRRATAVITTLMHELGPSAVPYLPLRAQACYAPSPENYALLTMVDTRQLQHCDAVLFMPGVSMTTGLEVEMAARAGKFITGSVVDLVSWAKGQKKAAA